MKYLLVFLILVLAIGANLPDNILARYGLDSTMFTVGLAAVAFTGAIAFHRIGLIIVMLVLAIGANLPESVAMEYNLDRDILLATLIALIIVPFVQRHLDS